MRSSHRNTVSVLAAILVVSAAVYVWICRLSFDFQVHTLNENLPEPERPLLLVLGLFAFVFVLYIFAASCVRNVHETQQRNVLWLVVFGAILFRGIMLFSNPIQEVDIYRYLWDGITTTQGVSPYRYPPQTIIGAAIDGTTDPQLQRLADLVIADGEMAEVLRRVHFGWLPTVYPTSSQAVFALSAATTPGGASVRTRVRVMKFWLIVCDLATLGLVMLLLRWSRLPTALSLLYGWCPLLMKEVANSGHLDAIAVLLTTLAVCLVSRCLLQRAPVRGEQGSESSVAPRKFSTLATLVGASLVLALAVGAKLYAIVLTPLIALVVAKRFGWKSVLVPAVLVAAVSFALVFPLLPGRTPPEEIDSGSGMEMFLKSWEMNDFIFMVIIENLKPAEVLGDMPHVWFSVLPESLRSAVCALAPATVPLAEKPFWVTRLFTSVVFVGVALWIAFGASREMGSDENDPEGSHHDVPVFVRAAFVTIAWFWLLSPTQNPWYWTWVLPLLPFMRNRAWWAVSGLAFLYYMRFWFEYHCAGGPVLGTSYVGAAFFDFIVPWIEFAPWFVGLFVAFRLMPKNVAPA